MQVARQLVHRSPKQAHILPARFSQYALMGAILVLALLAILAWQLSGNLHTSASTTSHPVTHSLSQMANVSPAATPSDGDPWPHP